MRLSYDTIDPGGGFSRARLFKADLGKQNAFKILRRSFRKKILHVVVNRYARALMIAKLDKKTA